MVFLRFSRRRCGGGYEMVVSPVVVLEQECKLRREKRMKKHPFFLWFVINKLLLCVYI